MVLLDRKGVTVWAGEFHTVVGEGKVASFAAGCKRDELSWAYLHLTDGTVAMVDLTAALRASL
jgi:hypothetical protein